MTVNKHGHPLCDRLLREKAEALELLRGENRQLRGEIATLRGELATLQKQLARPLIPEPEPRAPCDRFVVSRDGASCLRCGLGIHRHAA